MSDFTDLILLRSTYRVYTNALSVCKEAVDKAHKKMNEHIDAVETPSFKGVKLGDAMSNIAEIVLLRSIYGNIPNVHKCAVETQSFKGVKPEMSQEDSDIVRAGLSQLAVALQLRLQVNELETKLEEVTNILCPNGDDDVIAHARRVVAERSDAVLENERLKREIKFLKDKLDQFEREVNK